MNAISRRGQRAAVLAAASVTPLVLKLAYVDIGDGFKVLGYPNPVLDGFSWYKSIFAVVCGACALILTAVNNNRRGLNKIDRLLAVLALLSIASSMSSPFRSVGLVGVPYLFEGLPTFLAYLALTYSASRSGSVTIEQLPVCLALTTILIAVIALPEEKEIFLLNTPWIARILLNLPGHIQGIYNTRFYPAAAFPFGNPNYVGVFSAMLWPFMVAQAWSQDKARSIFLYSAVSGLALAVLLGSGSRAGIVSGAVAVLLCCVIAMIRLPCSIKQILGFFLAIGLGIGLNSIFSMSSPTKRLASIPDNAFPNDGNGDSINSELQDSVSIKNGRLRIVQKNKVLLIERLVDSLKFMDGKYRPLSFHLIPNTDNVVLDDPDFASFRIHNTRYANFPALEINGFTAAITGSGFRIQRLNSLIIPTIGAFVELPFSESAFSDRGFIWSRSLPLLADKLILGHGPAAFPFEFPNADVQTMSHKFNSSTIVDKPHSLYISLAFSYGILALLLTAILFAGILVQSFRLATTGDSASCCKILPYLGAILSFIISSVFNDSTVGVSTPFWVMLGLAAGIYTETKQSKPALGYNSII